jgi:hypothetical protein
LVIFREAEENLAIHENCYEFFRMIAKNDGTRHRENAKGIAQDQELVAALWQAVTAYEFQFRMLSALREERQKLIDWGVSEEDLPLPAWLPASAPKPE